MLERGGRLLFANQELVWKIKHTAKDLKDATDKSNAALVDSLTKAKDELMKKRDAMIRLDALPKDFVKEMDDAKKFVQDTMDKMTTGAQKDIIIKAKAALDHLIAAQVKGLEKVKTHVGAVKDRVVALAGRSHITDAFPDLGAVKDYTSGKFDDFDTKMADLKDDAARKAVAFVDDALDGASEWMVTLDDTKTITDLGNVDAIKPIMGKMGMALGAVEAQIKLADGAQLDQLEAARDALRKMKGTISDKLFDASNDGKWKAVHKAQVDKAKDVFDKADATKEFVKTAVKSKLGAMATDAKKFLEHAESKANLFSDKANKITFAEASAALDDAATHIADKGLAAVANMQAGTVERLRAAKKDLADKASAATGDAKAALADAQAAIEKVLDARDEAWEPPPPADLADACKEGRRGVKCLSECRLAIQQCFRDGADQVEDCKKPAWDACKDVAKESVPEPPRDLEDRCARAGDAGCAHACGKYGAKCLLSKKDGFELPGCADWVEHCDKMRPADANAGIPAPPSYLAKVCRSANVGCRTACAPAKICLLDRSVKGCAAYAPCTVLAEKSDAVFEDDADRADRSDEEIDAEEDLNVAAAALADLPELFVDPAKTEGDVKTACRDGAGAACSDICGVAALRCKFTRDGEDDAKCDAYRSCQAVPDIRKQADDRAKRMGYPRAQCPKNKETGAECSKNGFCPDDGVHRGRKCKCKTGYFGRACERKHDSAEQTERVARAADRADKFAKRIVASKWCWTQGFKRTACPADAAREANKCVTSLKQCHKDGGPTKDDIKAKMDTCTATQVYCGMRCVDRKVGCLATSNTVSRCAEGDRRCPDGSCAKSCAKPDVSKLCPKADAGVRVPCGDGMTCGRSRKECDLTVPRDGPPPGARACRSHPSFWVTDASDNSAARKRCARLTGCPTGTIVCGVKRDKNGKVEQEDIPDELQAVLEADAEEVDFGEPEGQLVDPARRLRMLSAAKHAKREGTRTAAVRSMLKRPDGSRKRRARPLCVPKADCKPGRGRPAKPEKKEAPIDPIRDQDVVVHAGEDVTVPLAKITIPRGSMHPQGDATKAFNLHVEPVSDGVLESSPAIKDFRNGNKLATELFSISADTADFEVLEDGVQVDLVVSDHDAHKDAAACKAFLKHLVVYSLQDVKGDAIATKDEQGSFDRVDGTDTDKLTAETNLRKEAKCKVGASDIDTAKGHTCTCRYIATHFTTNFAAVDNDALGDYIGPAPTPGPGKKSDGESEGDGKLTTGGIVGIVIGGLVLLVAIAVGITKCSGGHTSHPSHAYERRPSNRNIGGGKPMTSHDNPAFTQVVVQSPMGKASPNQSPWVKGNDPKSGRTYWHNAKTNESTWINPEAVSQTF